MYSVTPDPVYTIYMEILERTQELRDCDLLPLENPEWRNQFKTYIHEIKKLCHKIIEIHKENADYEYAVKVINYLEDYERRRLDEQ